MVSYNATVVVRTTVSPDDLVDAFAGLSPVVGLAPAEYGADLEVVLTLEADHLIAAIGLAVQLLAVNGCDARWVTASTTAEFDAWFDATA